MGILFAAVVVGSDELFGMAFVPLLVTVACICVVVLKELEVD